MDKLIVHVDADLQDLLPTYLARRRQDVATLTQALNRGDYEAIRVIGHNMKGTGSGYGLEVVGRVGDELEQAAPQHDTQAIVTLINRLDDYLRRLEVVFD
ncbi:MAG: Hpt domain-containing protein [Gammaproteobacteria bacterium]|nr:Hpt domain-containing protein [Gammaproteobacteria bacterium]